MLRSPDILLVFYKTSKDTRRFSKMNLKRKALSIEQKLKILKAFDNRSASDSLKSVAKSLDLPPSTLQTIVKTRAKIEESAVNSSSARKKIKSAKYENVEKILVEWITQARHANIALSGPIIIEKAVEVARTLNVENFNPGTGWLDRFNKRYGIVHKQICGESEAVNTNDMEAWINHILPTYIDRYDPKDIFNVDEFGLFFKLTPNKTYTLKGEKCHGGKLSKERLTVLAGCNMDGTEKLKLLVIGKSQNPRCLKNVNKNKLKCEYDFQKKAWMTGERFKKYLKNLDQRMGKKNRKILLFVDNCPDTQRKSH